MLKRNSKKIITVHDELLFELYSLRPDTISYELINGNVYLVNSVKSLNYEIGLRVKLEYENVNEDDLKKISSFKFDISIYYEQLCFSNIEKYVCNVLFDKFLSTQQDFDITFSEIEYLYRGKCSKKLCVLRNDIALKYAKAFDSLSKKELFLITNNNFRNKRYGVRNLCIHQPFLSLKSILRVSKNNLAVSYSFGGFGEVIKASKRYSTILSNKAYQINFNELKLHLTGYYLARDVFITLGIMEKMFRLEFPYNPPIDLLIEFTRELSYNSFYKNPLRDYKAMCKYVLTSLRYIDKIIDIEEIYHETEEFAIEHEMDKDENGNYEYEFTLKDVGRNADLEICATIGYKRSHNNFQYIH